jgi:dethiobiotin synthetase
VSAPLLLVSGTGTEIGKTHVASAILLRWGRTLRVTGYKPVESGVPSNTEGEDAATLRRASSFHVKQLEGYVFEPPLSPHLAARLAGQTIEPERILRTLTRLRSEAAGVLVELPGGLFSPLGDGLLNVDLALQLAPTATLLVAPDRIGVLHDLATTTRAAASAGLQLTGIVLSAPATADASTGRNASEVPLVTSVPVLATYPRASADELARSPVLHAMLETLLARPIP